MLVSGTRHALTSRSQFFTVLGMSEDALEHWVDIPWEQWRVKLRFREIDGQFRCVQLEVFPAERGRYPPLTAQDLRRFPLATYIREGLEIIADEEGGKLDS